MPEPAGITVDELYRARTPNSARLYAEALKVLPGGVTHSNRYWSPYPIHVQHAKGSRMVDVDGNEYLDYWVANGTMFMGHANAKVAAAVAAVLERGTHFGVSHDLIGKLAAEDRGARAIRRRGAVHQFRFGGGRACVAHCARLHRDVGKSPGSKERFMA